MYTINLLLSSSFSIEATNFNCLLKAAPIYKTVAPAQDNISYYKNGRLVKEIPNIKELFFNNCYKIYSIFPDNLMSDIEKLSRKMTRHFGNESSDMLVKMTNETIDFSSSHEISNSNLVLFKCQEKSPLLEKIIKIFINRFANELKWVGNHTFDFQLFRYTPLSGQNTTQKWHYDQGSKKSMVMMIINDFEHYDGHGLNIALNSMEGPFKPLEHFDELNISPKEDQYISTNYPYNGAVVFDGKNGELVHQMSPLSARTFDKPKSLVRTIFQIKDKAWSNT